MSETALRPSPENGKTKRILSLFIAMNLVTLIFTFVPFFWDLPSLYRSGWYTGDDIVRFLEPVLVLPLSFWILWISPSVKEECGLVLLLLFMFFSAVYQQGAGFHSASAMFKHSVENFITANPAVAAANPELSEIYSWMRDFWEHIVSHYLYAAGGIAVSWIHAFAYRNYEIPIQSNQFHAFTSKSEIFLFLFASVIYGLIIASVAINFPSGSIVALVLTSCYGFGILGTWAIKRKGFTFQIGSLPVIHYFITSYFIGFIIVIAWVSKNGFK